MLILSIEFGMDESFYVVPLSPSPAMKRLQSENAALKADLQATRTRFIHMEKAIKERQQQERLLRDSIIHVRKEVLPFILCYSKY